MYRKVLEDLGADGAFGDSSSIDNGEVSVVSASDPLIVNLGVDRFQGPMESSTCS